MNYGNNEAEHRLLEIEQRLAAIEELTRRVMWAVGIFNSSSTLAIGIIVAIFR